MDTRLLDRSATTCDGCGGADFEPLVRFDELVALRGRARRLELASVGCRSCGLELLDPRPSDALLAELDARARRAPLEGRRLEHRRRLAERVARRLPARGRALDVGCGDGAFAALLRDAGFDATGCDRDERCVELARERHGIEVLPGDFEQLAIEPASLDLVGLVRVLEHLPRPSRVLARAREALRPGGHLVVAVPDVEQAEPRAMHDFYGCPRRTSFSPTTLANACRRAGFEPVEVARTEGAPVLELVARRVGPSEDPELHRSDLEPELHRSDLEPELHRSDMAPYLHRSDLEPASESDFERAVERARAYVARRDLERARFRRRFRDHAAAWRARGQRVALWGAGLHTERLRSVLAIDPDLFCGVVDGDPSRAGRELFGRPVEAPAALRELAPDVVAVSSYAFAAEIADELAGLLGGAAEPYFFHGGPTSGHPLDGDA